MKTKSRIAALAAAAVVCGAAPATSATYNLGTIPGTGITSFSSDPLDPATGSFSDTVKFRLLQTASIENLALTVTPGSTINNFTIALYTAGGTLVSGQMDSTVMVPPSANENAFNLAAGMYSAIVTGNISAPASYSGSLFVSFAPTVLGTPGPIAGAGLVPLLGLAGAYLFGRKRLAA